jgi:hypothetical protein
MDEGHPFGQRIVVAYHRGPGDAHRRILVDRFHDQRKSQVAGAAAGRALLDLDEARGAHVVVVQHHLGQRLVAGQDQPVGSAPV